MIIRSNTEWKVQGDKRITYLHNLAKRTFVDKIVPKIIRDSGTELINLNEIIKVQKEYYESLYKSKNKLKLTLMKLNLLTVIIHLNKYILDHEINNSLEDKV